MGIKFRDATPYDLEWILLSLRDLDGYFQARRMFWSNDDHARESLLELICEHFFRIAERDGQRQGFIAGRLIPHEYNPRLKTLIEYFWWVIPGIEVRARVGLALVDEFVTWGKKNADLLIFSIPVSHPVGEGALMRRGFEPWQVDYYLPTNPTKQAVLNG